MIRSLFIALFASVVLGLPARAQEWGFWIVAGSISEEAQDVDDRVAGISGKVEECGYVTFNDFSAKFREFTPGYHVVVVGPYDRKWAAETARDRIRRCVPDAYVKFGGYLGE